MINIFSRTFLIIISLLPLTVSAQNEDSEMLRKIYDEALTNSPCYQWLEKLCADYPKRLAGSAIYLGAVDYTSGVLSGIKGVNSYLQDSKSNYWYRGNTEEAWVTTNDGLKTKLNITTLGNSVSTPEEGVTAEIIEVQSLEEVEKLGRDKIAGKIVFYNRPMDPKQILTFRAYGGAVDQRVYGPAKAAEYGAVGAIVRSMSLAQHDYAHTGVTVYKDTINRVAGMAVSTNDANKLSKLLKKGKVTGFMRTESRMMGERYAPSVIGEIKGSKYPDEIIVVGGHLDAWDLGVGAHDDGAGVVQSIEVLRILNNLGYKPQRTIRCVLFANEENGSAGAKTYAAEALKKKEHHIAAMESDAGGFSPRGFSFDAENDLIDGYYNYVNDWKPLFEEYGLTFYRGGSGADVSHLKSHNSLLIGFLPDSQRYFDVHHSDNDTMEHINKRELELGAAAMTSMIYLLDKYGVK